VEDRGPVGRQPFQFPLDHANVGNDRGQLAFQSINHELVSQTRSMAKPQSVKINRIEKECPLLSLAFFFLIPEREGIHFQTLSLGQYSSFCVIDRGTCAAERVRNEGVRANQRESQLV
jgi:hypothetical protein